MDAVLTDFFNIKSEQPNLEPVELYDGPLIVVGQSIPISTPYTEFEYLEFKVVGMQDAARFIFTKQLSVTDVKAEVGLMELAGLSYEGTNSTYVRCWLDPKNSTSTGLKITAAVGGYFTNVGVEKVVGYKRRLSQVGLDEIMSSMSSPNLCLNSDLRNPVNQRDFNGDWAGLAVGDYGYDQWIKLDSTRKGYVIESGQYVPNAQYSIVIDNVVRGSFVAPSSGNFAIATLFDDGELHDYYKGQFKRPWHPKINPVMDCMRYYFKGRLTAPLQYTNILNVAYFIVGVPACPVRMRVEKVLSKSAESISYYNDSGYIEVAETGFSVETSSDYGMAVRVVYNRGSNYRGIVYVNNMALDASIPLNEIDTIIDV